MLSIAVMLVIFISIFQSCKKQDVNGPTAANTPATATATYTITPNMTQTMQAALTAISTAIKATQTAIAQTATAGAQLTQNAVNSRTATPTKTVTNTFSQTSTATMTPTATITPTTPLLVLINCSDDSAVAYAGVSGVVSVNSTTSILPLCNGWIIYGDRVANSVIVKNVFTGLVGLTIPLNAAPVKMAYDSGSGTLFATLNSTDMAKIDLQTAGVTYIPVGGRYDYIAIGNNLTIFLGASYLLTPPKTIMVVDGILGNVLTSIGGYYDGGPVAYDKTGNNLFVGVWGSNPTTLSRYSYNTVSHTLTLLQQRTDLGSDPYDMAVSPDSSRLIFCTNASTLQDLSTADINVTAGSWDGYARGAEFSHPGLLLVKADDKLVKLYDGVSRAYIKTLPSNIGVYDTFGITKFSGGDRIIYALDRDTILGNYRIHWWAN